jgi:hypothetical protein
MQVLSFFMFVAMAIFFILAVGYGLSLVEGQDNPTKSPDASQDVLQEADPKAEGETQA